MVTPNIFITVYTRFSVSSSFLCSVPAEICVVAHLTLHVFVQNYLKVLPIGSQARWKYGL